MSRPGGSSPRSGRLVRVFAAQAIPEALLAKGLLASEGIPVFSKGESEGPYRMGPVYLWVPEELEIQARLLLEEARRSGEDDSIDSIDPAEDPPGGEPSAWTAPED